MNNTVYLALVLGKFRVDGTPLCQQNDLYQLLPDRVRTLPSHE